MSIILKRNPRGFTLIELIISIGIILMITGLSIATYTRSREQRVVFNEARQVADLIMSTKRKVLAGEKPLGCVGSSIERFEVRVSAVNQLQSWAICQGSDSQIETLDLLVSEIDEPALGTTIDFGVVTGGITPVTFSVCGYGYEYQVEVSAAGSVSAPVYVGNC